MHLESSGTEDTSIADTAKDTPADNMFAADEGSFADEGGFGDTGLGADEDA
jgi:hypothetical protein